MERIRHYEPKDRDAVRKIFEKQDLSSLTGTKVNCPLPDTDPAVAIALVAEDSETGEIKRAFILRATLEAHLVVDPSEPNQSNNMRRMGQLAEGAAMELGVELAKFKFPVFTDAIAFVPNSMNDLVDYMKAHLKFTDEPPVAKLLWKGLGYY